VYLYHDFEHEVVINLADELTKGPHVQSIAALFPENPEYEQWAANQVLMWNSFYLQAVDRKIEPGSLAWMSGEYVLQEEADAGPVTVFLEADQLYLQKPNQLPIELYPASENTVFHRFFNGQELILTFARNSHGQATGAEGSTNFEYFDVSLPYHLTPINNVPDGIILLLGIAGLSLALVIAGGILWYKRKR
jgi:hypothetical protein